MNKENQTDLVVVETLHPELLTIAETSGMVLTEAQAIGSKFAPFMNTVNDLSAQINELKGQEITPELAKTARKLRLELVSNRGKNGLLEIKEELKAGLLVRTRLIDKYVGVVEESSKLSELAAEAIEKHSERVEAERLNKVYNDRVAMLEPYGEVNRFIDLKQMDEATFNNFLADTKIAYETRKENERKAEQERIDAEKKAEQDRIDAEKKAEAERLEKEKADKLERERIAAENEKLRLENEAKEKELAKEREAQAEKDRLAKIEQDKKDAEIAKLKAEQEAEKQHKEKELADEKARLEAEESEKLAKEKAALLAPDKDKVKEFFAKFDELSKSFPELKSEPGVAMTKRVNEALAMVHKLIIEDSKTLL